MSTISLRLPDSLHQQIKQLVIRDKLSINQFINSAVAEKISAYFTEEYLEKRAQRAKKSKFQKVLRKVKSRAANPEDSI